MCFILSCTVGAARAACPGMNNASRSSTPCAFSLLSPPLRPSLSPLSLCVSRSSFMPDGGAPRFACCRLPSLALLSWQALSFLLLGSFGVSLLVLVSASVPISEPMVLGGDHLIWILWLVIPQA